MTVDSRCLFIENAGFESRCLQKIHGDSNDISFLVGTRSLKFTNKLVKFTLDEDISQLTKHMVEFPEGFFNLISTCPYNPLLFTAGFSKDSFNFSDCNMMRFISNDNFSVEKIHQFNLNNIKEMSWNPIENNSKICFLTDNSLNIIDCNEYETYKEISIKDLFSEPQLLSTASIKWNPHFNGSLIFISNGHSLLIFDLNSNRVAHSCNINKNYDSFLDFDINPSSLYSFASSHENRSLKFWDTRNLTSFTELQCHTHWVNCVRYNPAHENLIATSSSDLTVALSYINLNGMNSPNNGEQNLENDHSNIAVDNFDNSECFESTIKIDNGVVERRTEHENTVCSVEWSSNDPWVYASLSVDGCFIIGTTSNDLKLKVLL